MIFLWDYKSGMSMLFWYDSLCEAFHSVLNSIWILKLLYKSSTAYSKGIQVPKKPHWQAYEKSLLNICVQLFSALCISIFWKTSFVIFFINMLFFNDCVHSLVRSFSSPCLKWCNTWTTSSTSLWDPGTWHWEKWFSCFQPN